MPVRCPSCGRTVESGTSAFPFCCDRCRGEDLYHWFSGSYRIAGRSPLGDPEESDGVSVEDEPSPDDSSGVG